MEKGSKSTSPRVKTFGRVVSVAFQQARQSEFDVLSKRSFRERYASGDDYGDAGAQREARTPQEENRGRSLPDPGQLEGSLPECP